MKNKLRRRLSNTFWYIILILGAVICMLPLYWLIRSSLMDLAQIFQLPPLWIPHPIHWSNYREALTILPFWRYFLNTMLITSINVVGALLTSSFVAFGFARIRFKWSGFLFGCVISSMMLPFAVTLIPTFIGWRILGAYGTFFPLTVPVWFGGGAFNIFLLRQFFKSIPKDLDEATIVDGGGYFRIWWQIVVPLSTPAMIVVGLFTFLNNWNDFFGPLIYMDSEKKYTLALGLQLFKGMYNAQWHLMMAAATVVLVPAIIVFLIGQKYFIEGITMSGLKA
ncbi:MAG: carbohydrate ABC transporter permease [Treponema sp.]|jgi:multiple sugar transport system permease protein|nr:carbohydrate ABC transporter permease [Treponema sp.]